MAQTAVTRSVRRAVQRKHRTSRFESVEPRKAEGSVHLCRVLPAAVRLERQVRERYGLAKLLPTAAWQRGDQDRLEADHPSHRISLRAVWRTSGPRLR